MNMIRKELHFKVHGQVKEVVDWEISLDEIDLIKGILATSNAIKAEDIEVEIIESYHPEVSETTFITEEGLQYKAPNPFSMLHKINGLKVSGNIDSLDMFLDKIFSGNIDESISFS